MLLNASAQIVADPAAPATQRPTVLAAPNNVPLVNIQTPSAAGVSRNTYSQFDVGQQGAILNNSRTNAQTFLGGWVQGNPWLANGGARVILNEVNSANPSQLRGFLEVAGRRAQVVVANPVGISCDGCGFINANRATLTTGTPIIHGGSLDGYRVRGGSVNILGAGMDAGSTDYSEIIARAVQLNAGIWASRLKVVTGSNQVDIDQASGEAGTVTAIAGSGPVPAFAIDSAALGGMYAGKIMIMATEAGVGIRNAGQMYAGVGEVVITADGQLLNAGVIRSAGDLNLRSGAGVANSGSMVAQGSNTVSTPGDLDNTGTISAQADLSLLAYGPASRISSAAGSFLGAGVMPDGPLTTNGNLNAAASAGISSTGQHLSAGD